MKRLAIVVLMAMLITGLPLLSAVANRTERQKTLVILGDSIATGHGLPDYNSVGNPKAKSSWSTLLAERYSAKQYNLAVDGDTTADLIEELQDSKNTAKLASADVICLSIGGNNFLRQIDAASNAGLWFLGTLVNNTENMLEAVPDELDRAFALIRQKNPQATVLVQTLYNPFRYWTVSLGSSSLGEWMEGYITRYNTILKEKIAAYGFVCVDVFQKFQDDDRGDYLYDAMGGGSLFEIIGNLSSIDPHPTEAGHRAIYDAYVATADELLESLLTVETTLTTTEEETTAKPIITAPPETTTVKETTVPPETTTVKETTVPPETTTVKETTVPPETTEEETTVPSETTVKETEAPTETETEGEPPTLTTEESTEEAAPPSESEESRDPAETAPPASSAPAVSETEPPATTEGESASPSHKTGVLGAVAAAVAIAAVTTVLILKHKTSQTKESKS